MIKMARISGDEVLLDHSAQEVDDNIDEVVAARGTHSNLSEAIEAAATVPKASASEIGGVKVGKGLSIENDGTLNVTGGGGSVINYSTTEQLTGQTWIDGKPIYQKTIVLRQNGTDNYTYSDYVYSDCIPSGIDFLIDTKWILDRSYSDVGYVDNHNLASSIIIGVNITSCVIWCQTTYGYYNFVVTIQYTKSSDTAPTL